MKPVKKKSSHNDHLFNDDFLKKSIKKMHNKRDRKLSIYDTPSDEDELDEEGMFDYDLDAMDEDEDDKF